MKRTVRILRHGDEVPSGEPRRFIDSGGYAILRWKVAPYSYVEVKEHRFVAGLPPGSQHVHHINGDKTDNRPENLAVLVPTNHYAEHVGFDMDAALADYRAGMGLLGLGRKYGVHHTSILRTLRLRRGFKARPAPKDRTHCVHGHELPSTSKNRRCLVCQRATQKRYMARKAIAEIAVGIPERKDHD